MQCVIGNVHILQPAVYGSEVLSKMLKCKAAVCIHSSLTHTHTAHETTLVLKCWP